jgi:hypothetical protein
MAIALVAASYLTGLVRAGLPLELLELAEVGGESSSPEGACLRPAARRARTASSVHAPSFDGGNEPG